MLVLNCSKAKNTILNLTFCSMLHCLLVEKWITISAPEKSLILEYNVLPPKIPKMGNLLNKGGDDGGGGLNQTPESGSAPYHRDTSSQ